jgi:hypothetical protein
MYHLVPTPESFKIIGKHLALGVYQGKKIKDTRYTFHELYYTLKKLEYIFGLLGQNSDEYTAA